ncbi:molybdenum ABC transporter ATP-binding protein [Thalassotalea atypica]|uniref:molybdenum ABC transporter ATP-binding protein n=1 Tax=Thalassotalea atypica TaxID=2054316 RepID=UPI0025745AA0|nr:molybdenum ABC transporter ATP-binding protein [Thalassotalea atypica]
MTALTLKLQSKFEQLHLDVELTITLQGITGIFGPSGSGKTSILKAISGVNKMVKGHIALGETVFLDSNRNVKLPTEQRRVTAVFQQDGLFSHLSVLQNLQYAVKRRKTHQIELNTIVKEAEIGSLLSQPVTLLSGGERQKVAIARALLAEPKLLILDEPVTALDRVNKLRILQLVKRLHIQFHIPILYVSHNLEEIQALADHLIVINKGQVVNHGKVHQVIHQLNHGEMIEQQTSLTVTRLNDDNQFGLIELKLSDDTSIFATDQHFIDQSASTYRCYILARDISLSTSKPVGSSIVNHIEGSISAIETNKNQVLVTVQHQQHCFYVTISTFSLGKLKLAVSDSVFMQFKASAIRQALY